MNKTILRTGLVLALPCLALTAQAGVLTGAKIASTTEFAFTIEDEPPTSVTNPTSFAVTVEPIPAAWQVGGGDGVINGSITSPALTVPGAGPVELTLRHRYNFEGDYTPGNAYDGGVVQVSLNGGEFATLDGANFTQNGYYDSPIIGNGVLKDAPGFNGPSPGFSTRALIDSVATIPGVASGDSIRVRFLGAWDDGFTPDGVDWEIAGVTVKAGATVVLSQDFSVGDGGFTTESTAAGAAWGYVPGLQPTLGTLRVSKSGTTTTLIQPSTWQTLRTYVFTITGKDTNGLDLVFRPVVSTPAPLVLAAAREWPASLPGPLGATGTWGVRTYLNEGINSAEDLTAVLDFLATASDRTPTLTPDTVIDTQEPDLNFYEPFTNGPLGVVGLGRPFPGDALSTSTNNGVTRDDNHVVTTAHSSIQIPEESDYTFNFHSDDGFMFRIKAATGTDPKFAFSGGPGSVDEVAQNIIYFPTGTGDADTRGIIHLLAGVYHLEYATWEGGTDFFYQVTSAQGFFGGNGDTSEWRTVGFSSDRTISIAYPNMAGDWTVLSTLPGATIGGNLAGADAAVDAAVAADPVAATSVWSVINFQDPEGTGTSRIGGDSPWPRNVSADPDNEITGDDNNIAMRMSGSVHIPQDGTYLFGYQGDDGARLTIGGVHDGFTSIVENHTGAAIIGKANTPALNSGSAGAAATSQPDTSVLFQQPGALVGSDDKAVKADRVAGSKVTVPFLASLNPITGTGDAAPFSVEVWAKPTGPITGLQAAVNSMIAGANQNPANGNDRSGYSLRANNGEWEFLLGYTEGAPFYEIAIAPGAVIENEWQHVVGTWDGTVITVYVNGVNAGETTPAAPPKANFAAPLYLGKRGFGDWLFNGDLDEAAVYGTALAPATILAHYENGKNATRATPYETLVQSSAPVGYWRLNETVQPRSDRGTISTNVELSNIGTVGRIFLTAGDYPISATFWEGGGGASFEIFASQEADGFAGPLQTLRKEPWPIIEPATGLTLVSANPPVPPVLVGGLTINPDGSLSITFKSVVGASYTLQSSTTLATWQNIETVIATSTTTTITGTAGESFYYNPEDPNTFHRVRAN